MHIPSTTSLPMKWAIFIFKWASGLWLCEWHECGRVKVSLAHKRANFVKIAQGQAIRTHGWAQFGYIICIYTYIYIYVYIYTYI